MWNPIRAIKQKGQEKIMNVFVLAALRQVLKIGGAGALFSDNQMEQAAGALSLLVGLGMSGFNAWQESKRKKAEQAK